MESDLNSQGNPFDSLPLQILQVRVLVHTWIKKLSCVACEFMFVLFKKKKVISVIYIFFLGGNFNVSKKYKTPHFLTLIRSGVDS